MAYFANGSEAAYYEETYCQRCIHYGEFGAACPILSLHMYWNYEACNGDEPNASPETKAKHCALNMLWPRVDGRNGQCAMFYERHNDGSQRRSSAADVDNTKTANG